MIPDIMYVYYGHDAVAISSYDLYNKLMLLFTNVMPITTYSIWKVFLGVPYE